uniref:Uncharacterized protein n=1 Tax=Anopheles minimus TaxID=112268 RepID=A0A182WPF2_9DIPT
MVAERMGSIALCLCDNSQCCGYVRWNLFTRERENWMGWIFVRSIVLVHRYTYGTHTDTEKIHKQFHQPPLSAPHRLQNPKTKSNTLQKSAIIAGSARGTPTFEVEVNKEKHDTFCTVKRVSDY